MSNARENVNLLASADWDIATLRLANWGSGAVPPQVMLKQNWVAGDGGGLFRYDASDTTTADDGGVVIVDAAGNRWKRQWDGQTAFAAWWGARAIVTSDQAPFIQAGINWFVTRNQGGTLVLPRGEVGENRVRIDSTLTVTASNITLAGQGGDFLHDSGTGADAASVLVWFGASGGGSTMVFFHTPSGVGNSKRFGGGLRDVELRCQTLADYGLRIQSWNGGVWHRLHVLSPRVAAYFSDCLVSLSTLAEAADNQFNDFYSCTFRCIDDAITQQAHGFLLSGSSNANTSLNQYRMCGGQNWNGYGFYLFNCDNNNFMRCSSFRPAGTGYSFYIGGSRTSPYIIGGGQANLFLNCGWDATYGVYLEGTEVAGNTGGALRNVFLATDNSNGSQQPTYGTGVDRQWFVMDYGFQTGTRFGGMPVGEWTNESSATAAAAAISTNVSLYAYNLSQSHVVLADSASVWVVRIIAATGDLQILRVAGSGSLDLPGAGNLKIGGQVVTLGNSDSGGTGFKLLRVPN